MGPLDPNSTTQQYHQGHDPEIIQNDHEAPHEIINDDDDGLPPPFVAVTEDDQDQPEPPPISVDVTSTKAQSLIPRWQREPEFPPFPGPSSKEEIEYLSTSSRPYESMSSRPPTFIQTQNQLPTEQAWKTDLFDCMFDPLNAIITLCCPCVTFGQIAEIVDSGNSSCGWNGIMYGVIAMCIGMPCIMSCKYRTKMRIMFRLIESPAPDWVVHCLCECCALCQEYRELKRRDIDPSIGWLGNEAKQQQKQQSGMAPPMQQRMM